jgi:hypothetical protein
MEPPQLAVVAVVCIRHQMPRVQLAALVAVQVLTMEHPQVVRLELLVKALRVVIVTTMEATTNETLAVVAVKALLAQLEVSRHLLRQLAVLALSLQSTAQACIGLVVVVVVSGVMELNLELLLVTVDLAVVVVVVRKLVLVQPQPLVLEAVLL